MEDATSGIAEARAAHRRGEWDAAYRGFLAAGAPQALATEDLNAMGDAAWWLGLVREAMAACEEVHRRCVAEGDLARAAMAAIDVGFSALLRGEESVGSGWISRARRLLDGLPESLEHGYLVLMEVEGAAAEGDHPRAIAAARRLHDLGVRFADATLKALALAGEGTARLRLGEPGAGLALLDEAMLAVLGGEVRPEWAGSIYCQVMAVCHEMADVRRAREWTEATRRWCEGFPSAVMFVGICRVHQAQLLALRGEWDAAEEAAERVCRELAEMNVTVVGEARYQIAEVRRLRGDVVGAERAFQQAMAHGRDPQPGLARLRMAQGRPVEGLAAVVAALRAATDPLQRAPLRAAQVDLAVATGDVDLAAEAAEDLTDIAATWQTSGLEAMAVQARGTVLLARGALDEALGALQEAGRRWRSIDAPQAAAQVRLLAAEAHRALGDTGSAAMEEAIAAEELGRLGAPPPRTAAAVPRRADAPGGLTRRELEILALVAQGSTNKDVAARLVISDRTVGRHLANIYLKLGISTRTAAAAWAHRHGVAGPGPGRPA